MDPARIATLVEQLVEVNRAGWDAVDGDRFNQVVHALRADLAGMQRHALDMAADDQDPARRATRADLLGAAANGFPERVEAVLPALLEMAAAEQDASVLASIASSLGLLWTPAAAPALLALVDHPDDAVRLEAARALPSTDGYEVATPGVAAALIRLSTDPDDEIRDWATMGLGMVDGDYRSRPHTPEVGDALVARLDDPNLEAAGEAQLALAERGDRRVVPVLADALAGDRLGLLTVRAAVYADPSLHGALLDLLENRDPDDDDDEWWLIAETAARRCDPNAAADAEPIIRTIVDRVRTELGRQDLAVTVTIRGTYPRTEVVLAAADRTWIERVWGFDRDLPDDPTSIDPEVTVLRLVNSGRSLVELDPSAGATG